MLEWTRLELDRRRVFKAEFLLFFIFVVVGGFFLTRTVVEVFSEKHVTGVGHRWTMSTFPIPDWCAPEPLIFPWSMCVNRPAVCVTVMLLLAAAHSKRACDYSAIISTYRALILVELQTLNLTGTFDVSKEKDHCPSEKVHRVLRYIYNMTQIFICLSDRQRHQHADRMTKVVGQMELLITRNCRKPERLANRRKKASCKPGKKRKGRQRRRMKMMGMLINCWQRLLSVTAY